MSEAPNFWFSHVRLRAPPCWQVGKSPGKAVKHWSAGWEADCWANAAKYCILWAGCACSLESRLADFSGSHKADISHSNSQPALSTAEPASGRKCQLQCQSQVMLALHWACRALLKNVSSIASVQSVTMHKELSLGCNCNNRLSTGYNSFVFLFLACCSHHSGSQDSTSALATWMQV